MRFQQKISRLPSLPGNVNMIQVMATIAFIIYINGNCDTEKMTLYAHI